MSKLEKGVLKMKTILRIYEAINDTMDENGYIIGCNNQFNRDLDEYNMLFDNVKADKTKLTIETEKATIYYFGAVNEFPDQLKGFQADVVEVYENCVDEETMGSVVFPMTLGDNMKIKFK